MAKKVVKVEKEEVKVTPVKKPIPVVKKKEETKKVEVKSVVKSKPVVKKKVIPVVEVKETPPPRVIRTSVPVIKNPTPAEIKVEAVPEVVPEKKLVLPGIPQRLTDKLVQLRKDLMEKEKK